MVQTHQLLTSSFDFVAMSSEELYQAALRPYRLERRILKRNDKASPITLTISAPDQEIAGSVLIPGGRWLVTLSHTVIPGSEEKTPNTENPDATLKIWEINWEENTPSIALHSSKDLKDFPGRGENLMVQSEEGNLTQVTILIRLGHWEGPEDNR